MLYFPRSKLFWSLNYKIRRLYVHWHPLLRSELFKPDITPDRISWIMRDAPLIHWGIPFFMEPWINCNDIWGDKNPNPPPDYIRRSYFRMFFWVFPRNLYRDFRRRFLFWRGMSYQEQYQKYGGDYFISGY